MGGGDVFNYLDINVLARCWRFWGGTKGSDEEHITYSGGTKIKDLGQCGWGEKKMKEKEKEKERIKYDESVKY